MDQTLQPAAPAPFRLIMGETDIFAFSDGTLSAPVGNLYRLESSEPTPERFPEAPTELSVNVFLVKSAGRLVLIDTGSGALFGPDHGKLRDGLAALAIQPEAIGDIILTHIHADHSGGLMIDGKQVFPNATLHLGRTEADFWLSPGAADAPNATERLKGQIARAHAMIDPYQNAGQVKLFADEGEIIPGFSASLRAGHTPGHLTIFYKEGHDTIAFVGDIVHGDTVQFKNPAVTIDFDYDQKNAAHSRAICFAEAADQGFTIAGVHIPFPGLGKVTREGDGYRFEPVNR
ncbi:MBL fold metallo-hydrolase [Allorhizobium sp. BGMRC 0089]|uniref:MBL fold metallo-hydrolase n=1 Tax=Allorhizobium sonneratiae TaxID=2934936 RepID=UPI002034546F|nr:MBL fold metallo-hydrolase [Allorhizobium sonneratiae]MCM2291192.1 MBL fold metallo-hydrolase [Allorhizobium sonneratiae]